MSPQSNTAEQWAMRFGFEMRCTESGLRTKLPPTSGAIGEKHQVAVLVDEATGRYCVLPGVAVPEGATCRVTIEVKPA